MGRPKKADTDIVDILEAESDDKACISCVHNIRVHEKENPLLVKENRCDIDWHIIGYCQNWYCTCKYHALKR